jgi:hypothetical protein
MDSTFRVVYGSQETADIANLGSVLGLFDASEKQFGAGYVPLGLTTSGRHPRIE